MKFAVVAVTALAALLSVNPFLHIASKLTTGVTISVPMEERFVDYISSHRKSYFSKEEYNFRMEIF